MDQNSTGENPKEPVAAKKIWFKCPCEEEKSQTVSWCRKSKTPL